MGRQLTDNRTRYWLRIPWVDGEPVPNQAHAVMSTSGMPMCWFQRPGAEHWRLSNTDPITIEPGVDFLGVDPRVCRLCLVRADANPDMTIGGERAVSA